MPFLLPPSEYKLGELSQLGLTGTCELQICRSAGPWSLGTPDKVECSIQNAYLKGMHAILHTGRGTDLHAAIQLSEHFVYIENQFFITSYVDLFVTLFVGNPTHEKGQWWMTLVLKTKSAMRSSIASSAHTARVQSGGAASLFPSFLGFRSLSTIPTPAL